MSSSRLQTLIEMSNENPHDSFITYAIAKEYESLQNLTLAEEHYRKILKSDPDYVGMYYHFGKLLWNLGRDAECIDILDKGISVADKTGDKHALGELKQLRWELSDDE